MSNAFTKTYLTKLIDDRIAKLRVPEGQQTDDMKRLVLMRRENLINEGRNMAARLPAMIATLEIVLAAYERADADSPIEERRQTQRALSEAIRAIDALKGQITQIHSYQSLAPIEDRVRKEQQRPTVLVDNEIARLNRVRSYVVDSPAEEFSITLMKSLGFIDIIKAAING